MKIIIYGPIFPFDVLKQNSGDITHEFRDIQKLATQSYIAIAWEVWGREYNLEYLWGFYFLKRTFDLSTLVSPSFPNFLAGDRIAIGLIVSSPLLGCVRVSDLDLLKLLLTDTLKMDIAVNGHSCEICYRKYEIFEN